MNLKQRIIEWRTSENEPDWHAFGQKSIQLFPEIPNILKKYLNVYIKDTGYSIFHERFDAISKNISPRCQEEIKCLAKSFDLSEWELTAINLIGDICRPTGCKKNRGQTTFSPQAKRNG